MVWETQRSSRRWEFSRFARRCLWARGRQLLVVTDWMYPVHGFSFFFACGFGCFMYIPSEQTCHATAFPVSPTVGAGRQSSYEFNREKACFYNFGTILIAKEHPFSKAARNNETDIPRGTNEEITLLDARFHQVPTYSHQSSSMSSRVSLPFLFCSLSLSLTHSRVVCSVYLIYPSRSGCVGLCGLCAVGLCVCHCVVVVCCVVRRLHRVCGVPCAQGVRCV